MPTNAFSVRWSGTFWFEEGTYRFYAKVDDGVRVYVDDVLQINGWRDGSFRQYYKDVWLCAGDHSVRVEYYDRIQVAKAYAWWKAISGPAVATPTPTSTAAPPSGVWYGEYFNNKELQGTPVYRSHDAAIGFDWGAGRPSREVWHDGWSACWVTRVSLKNDHYRFCAMSDDGVRIWVNNQLVVDEWHANNGVAYCGAFWSSGGTYPVKVEYYEDGGNALLYVWWEPH